MKEFSKETQPIFYRILEKSFKENKKTHAFLLVGDHTDDIATFIAQSYICHEDTLACETCDDCIRIKEGLYPDMIVCDGKEASIKKSDIDHIQEEFVKSSVENNGKVYILKNIDNATTQAMNSLLKFLEEPVEEVYAILTTKNINKVLPTIQSRCQVIKLLPESKHSLELKLKNEGVDEEDSLVLPHLFDSIEECNEYKDSELYFDVKNYVFYFIEDLYMKPSDLLINLQINLGKKYKKNKEAYALFLNLLVLGMRDMFHVKHSIPVLFVKHKDFFEKMPEDGKILQKIEIILEYAERLNNNVNLALLLDGMVYKILKGV